VFYANYTGATELHWKKQPAAYVITELLSFLSSSFGPMLTLFLLVQAWQNAET